MFKQDCITAKDRASPMAFSVPKKNKKLVEWEKKEEKEKEKNKEKKSVC